MDWAMNKYLIRKLLFVASLALLAYSPFGIAEYKSRTTTDPYILMARAIEAFDLPGVDAIKVWDNPGVQDGLAVLVNIDPYPDWTSNQRENFTRYVLEVTRGDDRGESPFIALELAIGWDYPSDAVRVQLIIICTDLRASSCNAQKIPGMVVDKRHIEWPGIGKP